MRLRWLSGVVFIGVIASCGGDDDLGTGGFPSVPTAGGPGGTTGGTTPGGTMGGNPTPGGLSDAGTSPVGSPTGGTAGGGSALPCDIATILKDKCQTCHGNPLMSGPMALITHADLQVKSTLNPAQNIAARVKARINDMAMPMPPKGRPELTADEKAKLLAYIDGGAKPVATGCTTGPVVTTPGGMTGGGGGTTGGGRLGEYLPPDSECTDIQDLLAHGGQTPGDTTPYTAPTGGDHYEIFYFKPKWTVPVHTIRIDPIIDNGAVLHHWLLYMEPNGAGDGTHKSDLGLQPSSSQLLSGWAPGNKSIPLGREIGLETITGPNSRFGIELHYNTNANPAKRTDRSGARLCVTSKLRPKTAAVHWLGTQGIISLGLGGMYDAFGTCTVPKESHIIAHSPHMHVKGRYMKTINKPKAGGAPVAITDKPFAFDDQQIYPIETPTGEIVVQPGDVITTTCTYDGSASFSFGPNTDQEMCYNFVVAWPVGSLAKGAGIVGGKNTCID
jgi:hypothetical protein